MCNKDDDTQTSQYIGIDLGAGKKGKSFTTKFIFEKQKKAGTVAMIFNPLGLNGASILNKSIHCVITSTYVSIQLLSNGSRDTYAEHVFSTPLSLDGFTENTATISINNNTITTTINGTTYVDTFTGYNLDNYNGRYAIYEFYCLSNRTFTSLPEFTYVDIVDNANTHYIDNFHRPNGLLTVMPNGTPYTLF